MIPSGHVPSRVEPDHMVALYTQVTFPLLFVGLTPIDGSLNTGCR